ncbi:hypothetical protein Droror1_Dr00012930 [Drosera rotundifolia]
MRRRSRMVFNMLGSKGVCAAVLGDELFAVFGLFGLLELVDFVGVVSWCQRLQMDHKVSCPWLLRNATNARIYASAQQWHRALILNHNFFLVVGYYYFFSSQIRRSIVYGDLPRNRLDLYLPKDSNRKKPVVAFVTGGAWIIGYKAWGCLLGQQLSERGIIVACIDYRNFPQGTISDMVEDASRGISFVCNSITEYGGDPDRVYLMGQSAGAHIVAWL